MEPDTKEYFLKRMKERENEDPDYTKEVLYGLMEWGGAVAQQQGSAYEFIKKYHSTPEQEREAFLQDVWNKGEFKAEQTLADMVAAQIEYKAKQQGITPKEAIDTLFSNRPDNFMLLLQAPNTGVEYKPSLGKSSARGAALEMLIALD